MATIYETLLSAAILIGVALWIYSVIKKQSMVETVKEIKELISEVQEENAYT